jgi:anti-sigma factor RsiW
MHAPSAAQPPQRVCPHCSTIARTADARCPFCRRAYRRRPSVPALLAALAVAAGAILGGVALMLGSFGDSLDRELEEQVDVVQRDFDRDVRALERRIEADLDRRLPVPEGP